ncbi:MAG: FAD-binding protein, partial [Nitrospirales bacterium]|nr:FAD-binding protein [Nitrospirales bacterium]
FIRNRFPRIHTTCLRYGVDITKDLIPVSPAAHYIMGGVKTDLDGATGIPGLYAAGEVACTGVHGANRLASNSLLEGLVYGFRAGNAAAHYAESAPDTGAGVAGRGNESGTPPLSTSHLSMGEMRDSLRSIMWEKVGIIRCGKSLGEAREALARWSGALDADFATRAGLELKNMLTVSLLITEAALRREGSVGAHYRSDYPATGEDWQKHVSLVKPVHLPVHAEENIA